MENFEGLRIGVGITGSFCTFETVFDALKALRAAGAALTCVFSENAQRITSRFGKPEDFLERARALSRNPLILSIAEAEPLGPGNALDLFLIAPCTGNTLAKLAAGVTDTTVLMAAKGHLRNGKPLLIYLSTNDALGANLKNIGTLLNAKHIAFVPFAQDAPHKKPNSLVSRPEALGQAIAAVMRGEQLQPLLFVEQ
ncbi:MAG: dipicolinate synthase subunit B [Oscillospiraceae bacterium]|jgi:dipicolinate synthase subunit B|nr:dipicolinate synthase subunit B [Oscillospiraceae bacterium]